MHEIDISANKIYMCVCACVRREVVRGRRRSSQGRRTSGQERGQRSRVDAPWPRRCIHDIIYPCSSALCLCSCIRKRCARGWSRCSILSGPGANCKRVPCDLPPSDMSPPGFQREPQPFLPPSLRPPSFYNSGRPFVLAPF